ncbi:GAF and ANTAR domain-containing protein [Fodinibacter luteus]|uniref:GAF and ANTAR domain-containing protein n=1 Tax=Fodinibacter luteus TaxID=552064 RepID=A0ABP8JYN4_9MICO
MDNSATLPPEPVIRDIAGHLEQIATAMTADGRPISAKGVVDVALLAVPHAQHVGVTLLRADRPPRSAAVTDEVPELLDSLQFELRDGPCLDAALGPPVLVSGDVGSDARWPRYGPRCVATSGVRSMLSLRLPMGGEDHAGLNFYSRDVDAFSDDDVVPGSLLVPFVALVLQAELHQQDVANLTTALDSARMISTAVGILMATHKISRDEAFEALRRTSMGLNIKLRHVADHVELTGVLPRPAAGPRSPGAQRP